MPSSPPPYAFGVSEFTTWPWSFEQDVERYTRLGVEAIEVCEFKLEPETDPARTRRQLDVIATHGLSISSVQPVVRTLFPSQSQPEPRDIPARLARFRETIERFGELASGLPFVTNTGNPPGGNMQEVLATAATKYRDLADFAGERGARVALEPLNATIMNVESAIWTLRQGMQVVEAVDRPNFGICLDSWNIWQNADLETAIRACGDRIFVVQLSDWRTPRSFQDRLVVGEGEIPLSPLLRAVHQAGYRGPYVVEIFSGDVPDSLWKGDLDRVVTTSREGLARAWQGAFSQD
ncbi:MAG TPA: sugar phosphate isomerase/epimerase family protein [Chloroflexota bacterium]|nr:sugar phosphate isomerase/epimerase family protein [Chloroflexota bacterium]